MAELPPTAQFNFPPPPEKVVRTGGSTSYGTLAPRQEANLVDLDKVAKEQQELERRKLEQANRAQQVQAEQDNDDALTAEKFHAVREQAIESSASQIATARERLRAKQDEYDKMPPASLFGGQGTAGQIAMAVGLTMGAYSDAVKAAAAIRLQRETGASTVDGIIKGAFDRQRESVSRVKDSIAVARTGIKDANEAREEMLSDIDLKEASAYKVAARMTKARLASQGKTANQIASDGAVMALEKNRLDSQSKVIEVLGKKITSESSTTTNIGGPAAPTPPPRVNMTVRDLDGNPRTALSPEEAIDLRKGEAASHGVASAIKDLKANVLAVGHTTTESAAIRRERAALVAAVVNYLPALSSTGVLNKGEDERFKSLTDTDWLTDGKAAAKGLDVMVNDVRRGYMTKLDAKSAKPVADPTQPPPQQFQVAPSKPIHQMTDAELEAAAR